MDRKINDLDIKVIVDGEEIFNEQEEFPYVLALGNKECGFDEEHKSCGGDVHVEFCGSLNNATALIPAIITMVIANSDMKKDKASVMKFLNVLDSLVLEYMDGTHMFEPGDINKEAMN